MRRIEQDPEEIREIEEALARAATPTHGLPEISRVYGERLSQVGLNYSIECADGIRREIDWKMSTTDGVPVPTEHDFLDESPPFGDPL